MHPAANIFAMDLGQRTGFAIGAAGTIPDSGTVVLKGLREPRAVALANLYAFLRQRWKVKTPDRVVFEKPINLEAFAKLGNAENTVRMAYSLAGVVELACERAGIEAPVEIHDSTVRKHFIGKGRLGSRDETKAAVVRRCHLLGYLPRTCSDDNRADACAVFDWAAVHLERTAPATLHFFNEAAR